MRLRFPLAARLTLILSAVALLSLLLAAVVQTRSLSQGIDGVAVQRLEASSVATGRLLARHLAGITNAFAVVSHTPELRAVLELGHRATLDHKAAALAKQTGSDPLIFLDTRGRIRGSAGSPEASAALLKGWKAALAEEGPNCVGTSAEEAGDAFQRCSGAGPETTLLLGEGGVVAGVRIPLKTGKRRIGTLLGARALSDSVLADWSELVGARIMIGAPGAGEGTLTAAVRSFPDLEIHVESSLAPELATLASTRRSQWIAGAVVLAVALALSVLLARDFLRPLSVIREVTQRVGAGDFASRVGSVRRDELGDVARGLDDTLERLQHSQKRLHSVQRIARFGDWGIDLARDRVEGSSEFLRILGLDPDEEHTLGAFLRCFASRDRERLDKAISLCAREGMRIELDLARGEANGRVLHLTGSRVDGADGEHQLEGSVQDVTERRGAEDQIRFLAFHDALTGLPNRRLLGERLALAVAPGQTRGFSLLFFDLDRFKLVNDTLGHSAGDELLRGVSERISEMLITPDGDSVLARFGGDEFTMLLPGIMETSDVEQVAEALLAAVCRPFDLQGHETVVTGSVGIARWPDDGNDVETLLRCCDTALHRAKERGRNGFCIYDDSMEQEASQRWKLENRLRKAVEAQQFEVYYQPRVDATNHQLIGFEALLRWQDFGYKPDEFVPIAEDTGLIVPLGGWVMRSVIAQVKAWQEQGLPISWVSVNVSGRQLREGLVEIVRDALEASQLEPSSLEIEVTESALMDDAERGIAILNQLRDLGARVFLDDFGTGYSSLSYLRSLPISGVKIDRSFVRSITVDERDAALAGSIVSMAKVLNLGVVAEGVETQEQADLLAEIGCDELQGFLFGEAVPAAAAAQMLTEKPRRKRARRRAKGAEK